MRKNIRIKADTLKQARAKFKNELPQRGFILKKIEHNAFNSETPYFIGESKDDAIEKAKKELPDPFFIKGGMVTEIEKGTDVYFPINVQAESETWAEIRVKSFIEEKYFSDIGSYDRYHFYSLYNTQIIKKGFKGILGVGKIENTYQVSVYIKVKVRIKYNRWAVIEAEITDEINIANKRLLKYTKDIKYAQDSIPVEIEDLISQGVDINYCDKDGRNALFYMCHDYKISKLLIDKGIDFRKIDNEGDNILTFNYRYTEYIEIHNKRVTSQIYQFLRKNGIDVDDGLIDEHRQEIRQEEEYKKKWCPNCNKKVETFEDSYETDSGWVNNITGYCKNCRKELYRNAINH